MAPWTKREDHTPSQGAAAEGRPELNRHYQSAVDAGLARAPSTLPPDAPEEDIPAEAVRITRRP